MKKRIILDTNFLLIPSQFHVDIFSEIRRICDFDYSLAVVPETMEELKKLASDPETSLKDRNAARMALQLLKRFKVKKLANNRKLFKRADEAIIEIASMNTYVATQDRILRQRLKGKVLGIITLRQKHYLRFLGD